MDFPGRPNVITGFSNWKREAEEKSQRDGCRRKIKLTLLAFEMKEWGCESRMPLDSRRWERKKKERKKYSPLEPPVHRYIQPCLYIDVSPVRSVFEF